MKKVILIAVCLLIAVGICQAEVTTTVTGGSTGPTKLSSDIGGLSIGFIKVGSAEVGTLAWHPDFKFGPWGLGADINLPLGQNKPANYENFVLRYAKYDDSIKGLQFGILDGVTVGHGLIMNNYTTRKGSTVLLNNEQTGVKGYLDLDKYVVRGMGTRSNIYSARLEERINPMLTLGQYYINDATGRSIIQSSGTTKTFPSVSAIGVDATVPLPANFQAYAEAGQYINHGSGLSAGLSFAYDMMVANAAFLTEYRMLDKGFVPGYFGTDYENNPIDLASAEASGKAKNGYLAQLSVNALGLASSKVVYESYAGSNSTLMADLSAKLGDQVSVAGFYKQPNFVDFRSIDADKGAIIGADVAYKVNPMTSLIAHYKRTYNPATGLVESTQYYEVGINF